ncbi:Ig-like domain-containing protein [Pyxidicoccus sp. 3LFB2]
MRVVPRGVRGLLAAVAGVCTLSAASCGERHEQEGSPLGERPPQFREVSANLTCSVPIIPERELFIRDLGVVNDPVRTQWSGTLPTSSGVADGAWSFGRLAAQMAGSVPPEDFVRNWLAQWETAQTVNGQNVPARTAIIPQLINGWPKRPDGKLDLTKSPMRLLAIVNRMDVRDLSLGSAGEGRFVFGVLDASGNAQQFTVILEYDLPAQTRMDVRDWANRWHALGTQTPGTPGFNDALQAITDRFAAKNAAPGRPNGSALNQLRTNEIALASPWQLREFRLDATTGQLKQAPVALTPASSLRTSSTLASFINTNTPLLMDGGVPAVPLQVDGGAFRGAVSEVLQPWTPPGVTNPEARHRFALNTCDGCHFHETNTSFLHVLPRAASQQASVSGFVSGTTTQDPNGLTHSFNELQRRATDLSNVLCEDVQAPVVSLQSPDAGSFLRATVAVLAAATDDVGVSRVDFLDGTSLIGSDTLPPFTATWDTTKVDGGTHALTARAFDVSGNTTTAPAVSVFVDNVAPFLVSGQPQYNQHTRGYVRGNVNVGVSVVESGSGVAQVDFLQDSTLLLGTRPGTSAISYSMMWNTVGVPDGPHTINYRATDRAGNVSLPYSVSVRVDNTPPTLAAVTAPANNTQVGGIVTLRATASDAQVLAWVAFEVDGMRLTPYSMTPPFSATWDSTQKPGMHVISAIASDWAGNTLRSAPVVVQGPTPPMAAAAYDFTRQVPVCGAAGSPGCDSGTLLNGRGPVGPELYAPNTLQGACADGTSGTFHVDGSVDRLRVFTFDGTPMVPGKPVRLEATVWASSGFAEERVDFYFAPDAQSPVWTLVSSSMLVASGMNWVGHTFSLPASGASGLQAFRARFRRNGVAEPCTSSGNLFDDHDDLVFRVAY